MAKSGMQVERLTASRVPRRLSDEEVACLLVEHERLQEEVRQLRAAVKIYAEVARRTAIKAAA